MSENNMNNWPVICAAIAAFCSAVTAFLAYIVQRRVAHQSVTPLITLYNWQTDGTRIQKTYGLIEVKTIKNHGSGPALRISAYEKPTGEPMYYPHIERNIVQVVQPQEERNIAWQFLLTNASLKPLIPQEVAKIEHMNFQIVLKYSDIHNRRYYKVLDLMYVREHKCLISVSEKLTPGLILIGEKTIVHSGWFIRFMSYPHIILQKLDLKLLVHWPFLCRNKKTKKRP